MTNEDTNTSTGVEDVDPGDDDESVVEDAEDGDTEEDGGEDTADADGQVVDSGVTRPTGRDLLELLAADPEAQKLMTSGLTELQRRQAAEAANQKAAEEFGELVKSEDYEAIGRRVLETQRKQEARTSVADEILQAQFAPVYERLFAQPELQKLTAEEKLALQPDKFDSDASYVTALSEFVTGKRSNAAIEAEVAKRIAARDEAASNVAAAGKAAKSVGKTPAALAGVAAGSRTSSDLIRTGLRHIFEPDATDEEE